VKGEVMNFDYKKDIEIDPDNLDLECLDHASRYQYYSQEQALVRIRLDKAKRRIDVIIAEANLKVRKKARGGDSKITETEIKSLVEIDEDVKKAYDEYFEIKKTYDLLSAAVSAFDHRKRTLTNLVSLHGQGYFSSPAARPLVRQQAKKEMEEKVDKGVAEALKRGKK
jgi:hypothetical protein